jgi:hypothetical protein
MGQVREKKRGKKRRESCRRGWLSVRSG